MKNLFYFDDAQIARLEPCFPKSYGKPSVDDRRVLRNTPEVDVAAKLCGYARKGHIFCDLKNVFGRDESDSKL